MKRKEEVVEAVFSFSTAAEKYIKYVEKVLERKDLSMWEHVRQKRRVTTEQSCKVCSVDMFIRGKNNIEDFVRNMTGINGLYFQEMGILLAKAYVKKSRG